MSSHTFSLDNLPKGGERFDLTKVSKLNGALLVIGGVGCLISLLYLTGMFGAQKQAQFAYSWLFAFFFFFTLSNGGIFWTMLQHVTNSGWSVTVRRTFENIGANVIVMAVFALPLLLPTVKAPLWEWYQEYVKAGMNPEGTLAGLEAGVKANPELHILIAKYGYMNIPFWTIRFVFYFVFLGGLIHLLRKWSIQQDHDGDFKHTFRCRAWCAAPLAIYALVVTFSAVDWVMSLDYTWFSTMWGVYIFAGGAWCAMAVTFIILNCLRGQGYLQKAVSMDHYHIMGQLLFAFTVFWAYIGFDQFFLIWYANITEETRFYLLRNTEGWWWVSNVLVWGHFGVTFILLLSAARKKTTAWMTGIGLWVVLMHATDIYWLIMPERGPSLTHGKDLWMPDALLGDLVAFVGIGGIVGWAFLHRLSKASLYPCRDPRLQESVLATNIVD